MLGLMNMLHFLLKYFISLWLVFSHSVLSKLLSLFIGFAKYIFRIQPGSMALVAWYCLINKVLV